MMTSNKLIQRELEVHGKIIEQAMNFGCTRAEITSDGNLQDKEHSLTPERVLECLFETLYREINS